MEQKARRSRFTLVTTIRGCQTYVSKKEEEEALGYQKKVRKGGEDLECMRCKASEEGVAALSRRLLRTSCLRRENKTALKGGKEVERDTTDKTI